MGTAGVVIGMGTTGDWVSDITGAGADGATEAAGVAGTTGAGVTGTAGPGFLERDRQSSVQGWLLYPTRLRCETVRRRPFCSDVPSTIIVDGIRASGVQVRSHHRHREYEYMYQYPKSRSFTLL